jgi:ankyrin repeat protein
MAGRMSKEVLNQLGNACKKGDVEKLQNLFNEGSPEIYCNAVYKQIPLLTWAVKGDHIEVMDFLIENRADVRKFFSLFWFVLFCFFTRL